MWNLTGNLVTRKPGRTLLPVLTVLFLVSYGLLTMLVSLEAIFLSCFVLISQNRQADKERVRSDIEYEINVKAELEVAHLHEKTDRMHAEMLERFVQLEKMLARTATRPE